MEKIINDPVYGFIDIPKGLMLSIINHPIFQRLRRIKQGGFSHLVYPGAMHTRLHHALGAFHLGWEAVHTLRGKGVIITDDEADALAIALLLHDLGHGPFSHTLEYHLIKVPHEDLTLALMQYLNEAFDGALNKAIQIFQNKYEKPFLNQLISGQLDLDRMDYLARDSFFTGVAEGVIGYKRIIKMLNVRDDQLVVEEKGIYSIEKFLMARKFMYWQVYYHKAVISAERMLQGFIQRLRFLLSEGMDFRLSEALRYFLTQEITNIGKRSVLDQYIKLDDADILMALKEGSESDDPVLRLYATGLLNRKLFKVEIFDEVISEAYLDQIKKRVSKSIDNTDIDQDYLVFTGKINNIAYSSSKEEIHILRKNEQVIPLSEISREEWRGGQSAKYYVCYNRHQTSDVRPNE